MKLIWISLYCAASFNIGLLCYHLFAGPVQDPLAYPVTSDCSVIGAQICCRMLQAGIPAPISYKDRN